MGTHRDLISELELRLENSPIDYDLIKREEGYRRGEIDLYALKGTTLLIFEVKSNYTPKQHYRARRQLIRAKKLFIPEGFTRDLIQRKYLFEAYWRDRATLDYRVRRYR